MNMDQKLVALQQTLYQSKNLTRRWLHTRRKEWIIDKIDQYGGGATSIALEVGPGAGMYIPFLLKAADSVMVSDCEAAYLNYIARTWKLDTLQIIKDDITQTQISSQSIDLILFTEVIEHIKNDMDALCSLFRILKPGGILILTTPQKFSTLEIFSKIAFLPGIIEVVARIYGEPILNAGHINLMTKNKLKQQLDACGFEIIEHQKFGLYLPVIAEIAGKTGLKWAQRLEKKIQGSGLSLFLWTQSYVIKKPADERHPLSGPQIT